MHDKWCHRNSWEITGPLQVLLLHPLPPHCPASSCSAASVHRLLHKSKWQVQNTGNLKTKKENKIWLQIGAGNAWIHVMRFPLWPRFCYWTRHSGLLNPRGAAWLRFKSLLSVLDKTLVQDTSTRFQRPVSRNKTGGWPLLAGFKTGEGEKNGGWGEKQLGIHVATLISQLILKPSWWNSSCVLHLH